MTRDIIGLPYLINYLYFLLMALIWGFNQFGVVDFPDASINALSDY